MKYIVDIRGEIEGDYEIIGKYEEKPQGDLISREALKEVLSEPLYRSTIKDFGEVLEYNHIMNTIDNAPTVDINKLILIVAKRSGKREMMLNALRPQGEWLMESKLYGGFGDSVLAITCSICKESFIYRGTTHNFCPNCGAGMKMRTTAD